MEQSFQLLGLKPGASRREIQSAYRRLAKKYHPDVSRESDAEERFIEITEAYQELLEGPDSRSTSNNARYQEEIFVDYEAVRRERARAYARMRYDTFKQNNEAFRKAWYYESVKWLTYLAIYTGFTLSLLMFLAPLIAWMITGELGISLGLLLVTMLSSHVFRFSRDLKKDTKPYFENYE